MLADLPATRDFASSSASSFNAEPVAPMAQGSAPRGRHSMHGGATGDQLWVTPYVTRSARLAAGPERGCFRCGCYTHRDQRAMSHFAIPRRILCFGSFEVDLASGELRRQGLKIRLQDQPLRLLALLLERAGEVVSREELRDKLWPADTFVDFDHSLNTAVRKLREALGDSAETPRYVETIPRRGYRFIAPVVPLHTVQPADSADAAVASVLPFPAAHPSTSARLPLILVIVVVVCAAALVAYWVLPRPGPTTHSGRRLTLAVLPFDNLSGDTDQEYLSDGLTEEMITQLGRLEPDRLRVLARSSTWKYKRADRDIGRLRRELGRSGGQPPTGR